MVFKTTGSGDAVARADRYSRPAMTTGLFAKFASCGPECSNDSTCRRARLSHWLNGSAFVGVLAELLLAADRSYMLEGTWEDEEEPPPPATIRLTRPTLDTSQCATD